MYKVPIDKIMYLVYYEIVLRQFNKEVHIYMSEKEKDILGRIFDSITKLDNEKQNYIVGMVEGMAIVRDSQREKKLQEE